MVNLFLTNYKITFIYYRKTKQVIMAKEEALKQVKKERCFLKLNPELKNDKEVVLAAIDKN